MISKELARKVKALLRQIEAFLKERSRYRVWALATTFFVALLSFLVSFYYSLPQQVTAIERQSLEVESYHSDLRRFIEVTEVFSDCIDSHLQTMITAWLDYNQLQQLHSGEAPPPGALTITGTGNIALPVVLTERLEMVGANRRSIASAIGMAKGTELINPRLSQALDLMRQNLDSMNNDTAAVEDFYMTYASGDEEGALQLLASLWSNIGPPSYQRTEESTAATARLQSAIQLVTLVTQEEEVKVSELAATRLAFRLKLYATIPALLYEAMFLVVGYSSWNRWREARKAHKKEQVGSKSTGQDDNDRAG